MHYLDKLTTGSRFPEQCLTREEALRGIRTISDYWLINYLQLLFSIGMTIDPAYASFSEEYLGSIESGKQADYVVFSQDIMSIPISSILDTKVLLTVIDGKPVFGQF